MEKREGKNIRVQGQLRIKNFFLKLWRCDRDATLFHILGTFPKVLDFFVHLEEAWGFALAVGGVCFVKTLHIF